VWIDRITGAVHSSDCVRRFVPCVVVVVSGSFPVWWLSLLVRFGGSVVCSTSERITGAGVSGGSLFPLVAVRLFDLFRLQNFIGYFFFIGIIVLFLQVVIYE
jgi:hypothetical protein